MLRKGVLMLLRSVTAWPFSSKPVTVTPVSLMPRFVPFSAVALKTTRETSVSAAWVRLPPRVPSCK